MYYTEYIKLLLLFPLNYYQKVSLTLFTNMQNVTFV